MVSGEGEGRLGHQRLPGKTGPRDGHTSSTPSNVKGAAGPHCQSWDCGTVGLGASHGQGKEK